MFVFERCRGRILRMGFARESSEKANLLWILPQLHWEYSLTRGRFPPMVHFPRDIFLGNGFDFCEQTS